MGAAYMGAYLAGFGIGAPVDARVLLRHAADARTTSARRSKPTPMSNGSSLMSANGDARAPFADFMAFMTAQDAIFALYQGAAETGPRALGHRSILANPCNPQTRENLNARVKYREAIRPLAPMMTLEAAKQFFELSEGASDADYNAYNYMVLTAHARPRRAHAHPIGRACRRHRPPADRARRDRSRSPTPTSKALGRRIGVEVAVNTSFNVAGPIAQTPAQALDTLRRSKGLDAVLMFSAEGAVFAALHSGRRARRRSLPRLAQNLAGGNGAPPGA